MSWRDSSRWRHAPVRRPTPTRMLRLAATVHAALWLAACATPPKPIPKYVPPPAGSDQTAKLVMRGTVPAGDAYSIYVYADSDKCTGLQMVGAGNNARHPETTLLNANKIATVEFFLLKPTKSYCTVRYSFTPVAGKTYLLAGSALDKGCSARVLDMTDPEHIKPEPGVLRRNPTGAVCLPLTQSRAVPATTNAQSSHGEAVLREGAGSDDLQGLIGK